MLVISVNSSLLKKPKNLTLSTTIENLHDRNIKPGTFNSIVTNKINQF